MRTCLSRSVSATRGEGTGSGREPGPCQRGLAQREQAGTSRLQTYPFCWFRKKTDNMAVREKERGKESAFNEAHFNWFRDGHTSLKAPRRKKQDYFKNIGTPLLRTLQSKGHDDVAQEQHHSEGRAEKPPGNIQGKLFGANTLAPRSQRPPGRLARGTPSGCGRKSPQASRSEAGGGPGLGI